PTTTFVVACAVLLVSFPSGIELSGSTTAWFTYVPGWVAVNALTLIVLVAPPPLIRAEMQSMTFAVFVHWNAFGSGVAASSAEMNENPAGSVSRTFTWNAGSLPSFFTTSVYSTTLLVPTSPAGDDWVFVRLSSLNMLLPPTVTVVSTAESLSNSLPSGT